MGKACQPSEGGGPYAGLSRVPGGLSRVGHLRGHHVHTVVHRFAATHRIPDAAEGTSSREAAARDQYQLRSRALSHEAVLLSKRL
jgi:hypothetical protein